jgi:two-component system sensor histidine kinase CpxA
MADRIQSLLANERTLLGDISHELRSPLTRLGLAVELGRSGGDQEEAYARIDREAGRLNTLVGELLRLSQSDSPDFAPRKDLVRLDQMVEELAEVMELEASEKGCRIEVRASRIEVRANGEALRRAVENVLSNSIRFSPPSELIDVRIDRGAGGIRIRVRDRGPGVPPEALDRIFETFYRVDSDRNRDTGGVGLGLAIVARAISAHGGRATARNVNPGLEVEIWLPPEPAAARDVNPEARQSARPPLRPRASPNP